MISSVTIQRPGVERKGQAVSSQHQKTRFGGRRACRSSRLQPREWDRNAPRGDRAWLELAFILGKSTPRSARRVILLSHKRSLLGTRPGCRQAPTSVPRQDRYRRESPPVRMARPARGLGRPARPAQAGRTVTVRANDHRVTQQAQHSEPASWCSMRVLRSQSPISCCENQQHLFVSTSSESRAEADLVLNVSSVASSSGSGPLKQPFLQAKAYTIIRALAWHVLQCRQARGLSRVCHGSRTECVSDSLSQSMGRVARAAQGHGIAG
jgi:hypothetical protein